jgi:hypothetical protein
MPHHQPLAGESHVGEPAQAAITVISGDAVAWVRALGLQFSRLLAGHLRHAAPVIEARVSSINPM